MKLPHRQSDARVSIYPTLNMWFFWPRTACIRQDSALSTAIEFDVFSSPWPEVAAGEVVQLVSGFCPVVVGCAMAAPVSEAARTAAAIRSSTQTSGKCKLPFPRLQAERCNVTMVPPMRPSAPVLSRSLPGVTKLRRHPIFDA